MAQRTRPRTIKGIERRRILRRPRVSIRTKAKRVKRKFVPAIDSEVATGEVKPTREKIVAEKYMRTFWNGVSRVVIGGGEGGTYESAKLLQCL